jgi:hypothetical protein
MQPQRATPKAKTSFAPNRFTSYPCQRLDQVVSNYRSLLISSRNLDFFTSFYR